MEASRCRNLAPFFQGRRPLKYYNHQKIYQPVVAPFDGVITQHNIDVGSLITADATGGTSMFAMTQSDVIRVLGLCAAG
jgi:hypothetical protein